MIVEHEQSEADRRQSQHEKIMIAAKPIVVWRVMRLYFDSGADPYVNNPEGKDDADKSIDSLKEAADRTTLRLLRENPGISLDDLTEKAIDHLLPMSFKEFMARRTGRLN